MRATVEMAKEAGVTWEPICNIIGPLERFEALVRADEREACAKVCDDWPNGRDDVYLIGEAIRARSNT